MALTDPESTRQLSYDPLGRVLSVAWATPGEAEHVETHTCDQLGYVEQVVASAAGGGTATLVVERDGPMRVSRAARTVTGARPSVEEERYLPDVTLPGAGSGGPPPTRPCSPDEEQAGLRRPVRSAGSAVGGARRVALRSRVRSPPTATHAPTGSCLTRR
ncbi:MAG: hypothetical protein IT376_14445 [Polyangiaceae bacterium]|nr:hypothetical protein [Polyangiaceae bacterium]